MVPKDWLIALDVLEHIPTRKELLLTFKLIQTSIIRKGLIVRVPVSANEKRRLLFGNIEKRQNALSKAL